MIERPDPDALLAGPLGKWLASQQDVRDEARAKVKRRRRWAIIGAVVLGGLMLILTRDVEAVFWVGAIVGGGGFAWAQAAGQPVTNAIKSEINGAVARALELDFSIACMAGEEWQRACTFGMLPNHDKSSFEDRWSGQIGAMPFQTYEAHCQEWRGSGKDRKLATVFRGAVLAIGFARRFQGMTLIEGDGKRRKWFGGEKDEITLGDVILQRCDMVDPRFEDRFTVWGNDAVEARYLVHPEYIERMTAVEQAFSGDNLRALFCGGELIILLDTGDQFESGSLEASDDRRMLAQTIDQFGALADLARRLNEAPRGNFVQATSA